MDRIDQVVAAVTQKFNCFGGGNNRHAQWNPISAAFKDKPAMFAAGVDVREVVEFVLQQAGK